MTRRLERAIFVREKRERELQEQDTKPIAIGADDAAVELKAQIIKHLESKGVPVHDYGVFSDDPMLYPDIALEVAQAVADGKHERGILMCGTGIGVCITANKVPGIRAAVCHDLYSACFASSQKAGTETVVGFGLSTSICFHLRFPLRVHSCPFAVVF